MIRRAPLRRAMLYMQGYDQKKISKIPSLNVDCVCLDMEDGVAFNKKSDARNNIHSLLNDRQFLASCTNSRTNLVLRINGTGSGLEEDDIRAITSAENLPAAIALPKVESIDQVKWLHSHLERRNGGSPETGIIVMIESPLGLWNMGDILSASNLIESVIFGGDDYAAAAGATRTRSNRELAFPRGYVVSLCSARNIQALDIVNINLEWTKDPTGQQQLIDESREGFELGYAGKQVIHPKQIEIVQNAFAPDEKAVEKAKALIEAYHEHEHLGKGAFVHDGKMIDLPTVKQAEKILERAIGAGAK